METNRGNEQDLHHPLTCNQPPQERAEQRDEGVVSDSRVICRIHEPTKCSRPSTRGFCLVCLANIPCNAQTFVITFHRPITSVHPVMRPAIPFGTQKLSPRPGCPRVCLYIQEKRGSHVGLMFSAMSGWEDEKARRSLLLQSFAQIGNFYSHFVNIMRRPKITSSA